MVIIIIIKMIMLITKIMIMNRNRKVSRTVGWASSWSFCLVSPVLYAL